MCRRRQPGAITGPAWPGGSADGQAGPWRSCRAPLAFAPVSGGAYGHDDERGRMGIAWALPDVWFLPGFAERGAVADTEAGLLPGERLLWTGRPVRARVIPRELI